MIKLGELVMILDLQRQGLSISALARQVRVDRNTVRTYIAKGLQPPVYKKQAQGRASSITSKPICANDWLPIPPSRLWREFKERGFAGG